MRCQRPLKPPWTLNAVSEPAPFRVQSCPLLPLSLDFASMLTGEVRRRGSGTVILPRDALVTQRPLVKLAQTFRPLSYIPMSRLLLLLCKV